MILIADAGGTKTDWCCVCRDGSNQVRFKTPGFNPNYLSGDEIRKDIIEGLPQNVSLTDIEEVYYYGSGVTELLRGSVQSSLSSIFTAATTVYADSDLLGCARAVLGHGPGFVGILGTGMNSCIYDGENIAFRIPSFGFIMGDEGSGAYIGKKFIVDYLRGKMPEEVSAQAAVLIDKDYAGVVEQVYRQPKPNQYCAQFTQWVCENRHKYAYCHDLLLSSFGDFFDNVVKLYPDYQKYSFNCAGSVAYHNSDVLEEAAALAGMTLGKIIKAPLDGLIAYHTNPA